MKRAFTIVAGIICLSLVCLSCSKQQKEASAPKGETDSSTEAIPVYVENLLSGEPEAAGIKRLGTVKKIMRADVDSVLGPEAQAYLAYNLVAMASAEYEVNGVTVSTEVAQFASLEDGYGFYASLRPVGAGAGGFGTESFSWGKVRYFTCGEFVVRLAVEKEDSSHFTAQTLVGQEIDSRIPVPPTPPPFFMLFPTAQKIRLSNRYYSYDFLDLPGLDEVYSTDYLTGGDTVIFFLTMDESGWKFLKLREYGESIGDLSSSPKSFPYEGYSLAFTDPHRGRIVAGLVRGKLVGIIGYDAAKNDRLASRWVRGLK